MNALDRFWEILRLIFALDSVALQNLTQSPRGAIIAIAVVLAAGLSSAIAQGVVLFLNRIPPVRFIFSLLINAIIFAVGYLFLILSTWLVTLFPGGVSVPFWTLAIALAASCGPLIFNFLGALPYLGVPLLALLSLCHLLALVLAFNAVTELGPGKAFGYVALGWLVLQLLQQTVGQPIANLGKWLANQTAGVELASVSHLLSFAAHRHSVSPSSLTFARSHPLQLHHPSDDASSKPTPSPQNPTAPGDNPSPSTEDDQKAAQNNSRLLFTLFGLLGMALVTFLVVILLDPLRNWVFGWHNQLPQTGQLFFNLFWLGLVVFVVAGLLAPLETLGWWAGWFQDEIDTLNAGELAEPVDDPKQVSRYLIYLDGVSKSTFEYLPDVEDFLDALVDSLPDNIALIRGIMPYSVLNNPLDEDRPLAFLWRWTDQVRSGNPTSLWGLLVNLRNVLIVMVSADRRYGPLYNRGIAQVLYNGLINNGYPLENRTPITLIGYSGGGQMAAAAAPYLKRALGAPIEIISLGGVISGNCNLLILEHLYHLFGDQDQVEKLGVIFFPGRWKVFPLSFWNRAKRRGKVDIISLGPVGHQLPGGLMDPNHYLPDGRSLLEQTVDYIERILRGELLREKQRRKRVPSHYELYREAEFNRPEFYPVRQARPSERYWPIAAWMGRLILPDRAQRDQVRGALFEVYHTPGDRAHLVGQTVNLRFDPDPTVQQWVQATTKDVYFSAEAEYTNTYEGLVHPDRLRGWRRVTPLESLAGARPYDDMIAALPEPLIVDEETARPTLYLRNQPLQISGRFYALVQFVRPVEGNDCWVVRHYNRESGQFDGGVEEAVRMPLVVADRNGCFPSTSRHLERSPLNERGWYLYGAQEGEGMFVVNAIAPRSLFQLKPERVVFGKKAAYRYLRQEAWNHIKAEKGRIHSVLLEANASSPQEAVSHWQEGDRALLLHLYGGIGGRKPEPAATGPVYFGHFAYGMARVVREPLTDELRFDLSYSQVYSHNTDGLVAGLLHWSRYLGDRQFGWVGLRPVADILVKLNAFTGYYNFDGELRSPLDEMMIQLNAMTARYRIGDGTGGTYVGPANNCAQDSNRALFASIRQLEHRVRTNSQWFAHWQAQHPDQARCFEQLLGLDKALKHKLQPFGLSRSDWTENEYNLGSTLEDKPLENLLNGLSSWRTMFPRKASDTIVKVFLDYGASVWVLRTNQIGGIDPDIEPIAPMTF
jgi:predicted Abi (CAAX) family protease